MESVAKLKVFTGSKASKMALQSRFSKFSYKELERLLENSVPAKTKRKQQILA